jgi:ferritin
MLATTMQEEFNQRINDELYSWYLYLALSAYFSTLNLHGFAHWLKVQAGEEMTHAQKNYNYIIERNGTVNLKLIAAPAAAWDSPLAAIKAAYEHEQKVSQIYNRFIEKAMAEKDHAAVVFLQWFVNEQVEEEAQTLDIVQKLEMAKGSTGGLLVLDHHLEKRGA